MLDTTGAILGYFVGIPVALVVLGLLIFMRPGTSTRYRPNRGWQASEAVFGWVPDDTVKDANADDGGGGSSGSW